MTTQQPEALRLAELLELAPEDGIEPQTAEDAAAGLRRLHSENETLQAGYAAARLEIESLQARIKTMAEEHADELMVAHLDGRMREAQVMFNGLTEEETMKTASCAGLMTQPAGVYPAAPEGVAFFVEYGGDVFTLEQMRDFADRTHALRMEQAAYKAVPGDALDEVMRERDDAEDFINELLDEVLGADRPEWSSAYNRYDAMSDVRERITALHKPAVDKAWGRFQSAMAAPQADSQPAPAAVAGPSDTFRGDTTCLVQSIIALLELDAEGALVPHGIGGHARALLSAAASRLAAAPTTPQAGSQPAPQQEAQQPGAAYAALPDADRDYMHKVVAVAVTMLFDGYKEDVTRVFSTGELSEFVTITAAMGGERVEDIYRRAWDLLSLPVRASHGQAPTQAADSVLEDAARYRWPRHGDNDEKVLKTYTSRPSEPGEPTMFLPRNDELDRLIDAARAAQDGGDVAMTTTQGAHAQPEALRGAPPSAYSQEDRAFYTFWYGHMLNDLMQPPLAGVSHSTARYIWDAAIAHAAAPAQAADSVLEDAARLEFEMQHGSAIAAARKQGGA